MADNGSPADKDLIDPILQGIDRVQNRDGIDDHLSTEVREDTQDTQTRSNIHLGGRSAAGIGTAPPELEGDPESQEVEFFNPGNRHYPIPQNDPIGPQSEGFKATPGVDPDDPNFPSIGRATPQIDINAGNGDPRDPALYQGQDPFAPDGSIVEVQPLPPEDEPEPENLGPDAVDDFYTIEEDGSINGDLNVMVNDSDPDGDPITVIPDTIDTGVGVVELNEDGTFTFTPTEDFNGEVTFDYTITDGELTDTATVTIDVNPVNDDPEPGEVDLGETPEDTGILITESDLLAGATDVDDDSLSAVNVSVDPQYGEIVDNEDGTWTYNPAQDFYGDDVVISYGIADGTVTVDTSATIDVTPVNDTPDVDDNSATIEEDTSYTFDLEDFTQGLTDVENDNIAEVTITTLPEDGALTYNGNPVVTPLTIAAGDLGGLVFTPDQDENASPYASFDFTVTDDGETEIGGSLQLDPATSEAETFTINVTPVNDDPEPGEVDLGETPEDTGILITEADLLAGATDVDGDDLSAVNVSVDEAYGTITDNEDGTWTYNPAQDFYGDDVVISYGINDGTVTVDTSATIDVTPVNDTPDVDDNSATIEEDGSYTFSLADFTEGLTDVESDNITEVTITTLPEDGALTYNGNPVVTPLTIAAGDLGNLVFTPDEDETGNPYASFDFTVTDDGETETDGVLQLDPATSEAETFTIIVDPVNDPPELTVDPDGDAVEDETDPLITETGTLSFTDNDPGDTHEVTAEYNGDAVWSGGDLTEDQIAAFTNGFEVDDDSWDYSLLNADTQFLAHGETVTFSYDVTVTDSSGASDDFDTETVTITVTGTNDQPTVTINDDLGEVTENDAVVTLTDSGDLSFADVDVTDTHTTDAAYNSDIDWSGGDLTQDQIDAITAGFSVDADSWDYSVANADVNFLAAGETITFSYNVTATDDSNQDNDTSEPVAVTITINGTNDDPELTITAENAEGAVEEDLNVVDGDLTDSGSFSFADDDATDTHTVTADYDANSIVWSGGDLTGDQITAFTEGFSINGDQDGWDYVIANADTQFLAEGETVEFTYTVTVDDGNGGTDTGTVTITVTGDNDQPTVTINDDLGEVTENDAVTTLTDSGDLSFADVDVTDTHTTDAAYNSDIDWSGGDLTQDQIDAITAGFSVDADSWDYSVANADVNFLAAGETITFSYNVTATDDSNQDNDTSEPVAVTITINGTNDDPELTITAENAEGIVTEDVAVSLAGALTDTGTFTFTDDDQTDTHTVTEEYNSDIVWSGGTLTDELSALQIDAMIDGFNVDNSGWDYTVANSMVQFLAADETITFSYTVTVDDGNGGTDTGEVTITINGTNDAPELTVDASGSVTEDASDPTLTDSGTLSFTDVDVTDTHVVTAAYVADSISWDGGTLTQDQIDDITAGFSINGDQDGWDYAIANADVDFLAAGESVTLEFNVTVTDDSNALNDSDTETVTITIYGENDGPVVNGSSVIIDEDTTHIFTVANFTQGYDDAEGDAAASVTITSLPTDGTLYLNNVEVTQTDIDNGLTVSMTDIGSGVLTFTPDLNEPTNGFDGKEYATLTFTVSDGTTDSAEQSFVIDVTPVADAPEIDLTVVGLVETVSPFKATVITADNVTDTGTGYTVTTVSYDADGVQIGDANNDGIDDVANISIGAADEIPTALDGEDDEGGVSYFGVGGVNGGPDYQIGYNEEAGASEQLIITINDQPIDEITINYKYLVEAEEEGQGGNKGDEIGTYELYLDGNLVDSGTFDGTTYGVGGTVTLSPNGIQTFDEVRIGVADGTDTGAGTSDFVIASVYYEQNFDEITEVTHTYQVTLSNNLVDTDGSETLTDVTLTGVPEGTVFKDENGTLVGSETSGPDVDGYYTWTFTQAEVAAYGDELYMTIPGEDSNGDPITDFSLTASVTSEEDQGDTASASDTADGMTEPVPVVVPPLNEVLGDIKRDNGFGNGDDAVPGGSGGNNNAENAIETQDGTNGNDTMYGRDSDSIPDNTYTDTYELQDIILGGSGDDTIYGETSSSSTAETNDYLNGESGNDTLYGQGGDDYLVGEDGDDTLYGGTGDDDMFGGEGVDTFIIELDSANEFNDEDSIDGGAGGSWVDVIDLQDLNLGDYDNGENGWTVVLDSGNTFDPENGDTEALLGQDEGGRIEFADGGSITFENVEKIIW